MANCNSSKKTTTAVTTATCNDAGESILKSITKNDNVKPTKAVINGEWHNVLAVVSIDTSEMDKPINLAIFSGYLRSSKDITYEYENENDRPMLYLFKKAGCTCDKKKCDINEDGYEMLADYTVPFDFFTSTNYRVEHIFAHHYTDAASANTCVSSVCSQADAGVATYVLTFKDAEKEEYKICPKFEDIHLSVLAVENKVD